MLRAIRDRPAPVFLVGILFALLVLMSAQVTGGDGSTALETGIFRVTAPVVRLFSGAVSVARGAWESYVDLRGAREESQALRRELQLLELERARFESILDENRRLRGLLDLRERTPYTSIPARIVANESLGAHRTLLIDRGSAHGVAVNMPVVAPSGIVGRVVLAAPGTSKVQLITDADAGISVLVVRTRLQGLAEGRGASTLRLRWIPQLEDVQPGDEVVSSGLDRIYPAGFPVGRISRVGEASGVMKEIDVVPAVDSARLEEVLVLKVKEPGDGLLPPLPADER